MCNFNFDSDISDYDEPICINLLGISLPCVLATFTKAQCSKTVVAKVNFPKKNSKIKAKKLRKNSI